MNTPESDMEQMKFAREWVRAHAAKKMAKYEKKLRRAAKDFFGHPVAIAYLRPGVMFEIKETEEEAVKRRQQMYGCNGKCCDRVIEPETGEGQYFICGGIDTCDETRVGEFIGTVGAVLFIVLAPIMFIAGIVALIVFGI